MQQFDIPAAGDVQAQQQVDAARGEYYQTVSQELKPEIPTKFWA